MPPQTWRRISNSRKPYEIHHSQEIAQTAEVRYTPGPSDGVFPQRTNNQVPAPSRAQRKTRTKDSKQIGTEPWLKAPIANRQTEDGKDAPKPLAPTLQTAPPDIPSTRR